MQVHRDIDHLPAFRNAVITIGTFDGVHTGHQQIITQLKAEAAHVAGESVIITFHPHPRKIVGEQSRPVQLLNTLDEKISLLEQRGIDHLVVVPFNDAFANQSANDYIHDFLFSKFHPHTVIIGYDHRFGNNRQGDYHLLEQKGWELGFLVKEIPEHVLNEITISSTRVREAILANDISTANRFLGYPFFFEGTVVEGNKLGRTIGFPTANLQLPAADKLVPGNGVYAVTALLKSQPQRLLKGMMNIGVRPTVDGSKRTVEVNLFDFNEDIYGLELQVSVHQYLRGEVKFNGLDALKAQLANDKETASVALASLP
ncbi:bifunctional riboflavin kinase/FAD synthetase [Filimonas effusa]|uniref:Riboflavin biosynthesis protein n=1 Tax=Filimonas effusa TaxID=2508721 RepID=A0A4Q1DAS4_9BACT|nr:bifunctional riboflavin kinase/FAD synthetase [Filimonas effusa]RXK86511.1 bifunctional riboflavin kinase/FAD synthetase [Filimonas effusa]